MYTAHTSSHSTSLVVVVKMGRKRQRGGNFRGKKYQCSKQKGGSIINKIGNSKITKALSRHLLNVGKELGGMLLKSRKGGAKAKIKQMAVQSGAGLRQSIRQGPPKQLRNTIPSAKYVMYHQ